MGDLGFSSPDAFLADVRLRLDALGREKGALVVEGGRDRRIFGRRVCSPALVVPAGSRQAVIEAHDRHDPDSNHQIAFLVDCDYEVPLGRLAPSEGLVISENADADVDLVSLTGLRAFTADVVPSALEGDEELEETVSLLRGTAEDVAMILGAVRFVSARDNLGLSVNGLRLRKVVNPDGSLDEERLLEMIVSRSRGVSLSPEDLRQLIGEVELRLSLCQGHDYMESIAVVLRRVFNINTYHVAHIETNIRLAVSDAEFDSWSVVRRLKKWEVAKGIRLFS